MRALLSFQIRGMIVDNLKESFDKNTKPDHMVAEGLKRATGTIDELSPDTMVLQKSVINIVQKLYNSIIVLTGSVKVECSPPERKVVSSSHSRVIPKT